MGFFTRRPPTGIPRKRLSFEEMLMMGALIFVGLFVFATLFGKMFGFGFAPGPVVLLMLVIITTLTALAITKKMLRGTDISSKDMATLVIIAGLTLAILMYLPDLAPELFEQSVLSLKSVLPLP